MGKSAFDIAAEKSQRQEEARKQAEEEARKKAWDEKMKRLAAEAEASKLQALNNPAPAIQTEQIQVCKTGNVFLIVIVNKETRFPVSYLVRGAGEIGQTFQVGLNGAFPALEQAFAMFRAKIKNGAAAA